MTTVNQNGKLRDTQRGKLYKAERVAHETAPGKPLATVKDIERYLKNKVSGRATLTRRYGIACDFEVWPVAVGDGRGTRRALAHGTTKITIPGWARNEWIVLHEIAHIVHCRIQFGYARKGMKIEGERVEELRGLSAAHGWQYAAIYIDLVQFCMGAEFADALKQCFKLGKVRFRPKRTRVMPEGHIPFQKKPVLTDATAMLAVEGRQAI